MNRNIVQFLGICVSPDNSKLFLVTVSIWLLVVDFIIDDLYLIGTDALRKCKRSNE